MVREKPSLTLRFVGVHCSLVKMAYISLRSIKSSSFVSPDRTETESLSKSISPSLTPSIASSWWKRDSKRGKDSMAFYFLLFSFSCAF